MQTMTGVIPYSFRSYFTSIVTLAIVFCANICASANMTIQYVEDFSPGHNEGEWIFGRNTNLTQEEDSKKFFLKYNDHTWAPILGTQSNKSIFLGDYRKAQVTGFTVETKWFNEYVNPLDDRPFSIVLTNGHYAAYQLSTKPLISTHLKWNTFHFTIPSSAANLEKEGWKVVEWPDMHVDADNSHFEEILKDVQQVRFYYADPTRFYLLQDFTVGVSRIGIESK